MMKNDPARAVKNSLQIICILLCILLIQLPLLAQADTEDTELSEAAPEIPESEYEEEDSQSEELFYPEESELEEMTSSNETLPEIPLDAQVRPEAEEAPNHGEAASEMEWEDSEGEDQEFTRNAGEALLDEPLGDMGITASSALLPNEKVVFTLSDLNSALGSKNGITTVYFGADITIDRATGIQIHNSKTNVEVVGLNPLEPDRTEPYTLTDFPSATFTDTIYVSTSGIKSLHVRDLKIVGKNYYGSFSVLESSLTDGLTITYERVDYNGPQIGHHRRGMLRFIDCSVRIHGGNGGSIMEEFAEAKYLEFEGANTIDTASSAFSTFWHPQGGSFKIMDDSSLVLTAPNMGTAFGLFYTVTNSYNVNIDIGQRSVFDATISGTVALPTQVTLSGLTVGEGGVFRLKTTKTAAASVLVMDGDVTVASNATFSINGYGGTSYAVLEQEKGDVTVDESASFQIMGPYGRLLNMYGGSLVCNDPASVLLYNPIARDIQSTTTAGMIYVNAEQINYWTAAGSGGFDNPPLYRWKKADGSNFWINATIATGSSGNISAISSNYAAGDSPGAAPGASSFNMTAARVLAFGRLELEVNTPNGLSGEITGVTAPGATVRASFTQDDTDYTLPDVVADANGDFRIPIGVALVESTTITVQSNFQFLTATASVEVEGAGKLEFIVPNKLLFFTARLASKPQTVQRVESNWSILVSDTRGAGSNWRVYARVAKPLTHTVLPASVLYDALIFIDAAGNVTPLPADDALLIQTHTTASNDDVVAIQWVANRGILTRVLPGATFAGPYTAGIEWILIDAP